jgi:hypothetical protein
VGEFVLPGHFPCCLHHVVDLLVDPSDGAGAGEKALPVRPSSASCSRSTLEYLESRTNLGTESCMLISGVVQRLHAWLTLDMSLNTETCACSKSSTTSRKLLSIDSSSPTARVIRLAKLLRKAWSILSSQGEPGARKALYSPD